MNSAHFAPKRRIRIGCDLNSPTERVPGKDLSHFFWNWDAKFSTHKEQILQSRRDGYLYEDWGFETLGSKLIDVVEHGIIVKRRIRDNIVCSRVYLA